MLTFPTPQERADVALCIEESAALVYGTDQEARMHVADLMPRYQSHAEDVSLTVGDCRLLAQALEEAWARRARPRRVQELICAFSHYEERALKRRVEQEMLRVGCHDVLIGQPVEDEDALASAAG